MHAHTGLLCVVSIGNWAKPGPPVFFFIVFLFWQAGWHFIREQPAASLSQLLTKAGPQRWGQLLAHRANEREVHEDSGVSNHPVYLGGGFSVPHVGFRATKPYNEVSFWSSLEASHHLKPFDSVLSLRCWDGIYDRWLIELCHGDRAFNCLTRQFYKEILQGLL